jgi:hypothetical protein
MTTYPKVLLDQRLISESMIKTIEEYVEKKRIYGNKFLTYLEKHPHIGIITGQTKERIEAKYWNPSRRLKPKNQLLIHEFDEMLHRFLDVERLEYPIHEEGLKMVDELFKGLFREKRPVMVSGKYMEILDSLSVPGRTNNNIPAPNNDDMKCAADATVLSAKYKGLFLATPSRIFMKPVVSNAIEERLHFTPGDTDFILKELTKKDLS